MKRVVLFAICTLGLLSTSALIPAKAADVARPYHPTYMSSVQSYDWSGPYLGLQAGMTTGQQNTDLSFAGFGLGGAASSGTGFAGGIFGGYRWQSGMLVYGLEGDFNAGGPRGDVDIFGIGGTVKTSWEASLRPVVGVAINPQLLLYATAGGSMAHFKVDTDLESWTQTKMGWTVGLGADYKFNRNWFAGVQWRYSDYGKLSHDFDTIPGLNASTRATSNAYMARVGFNF